VASPLDDLPNHAFATGDELDAWLREHHARETGIWLRIAKRDSGIESVTWKDIVPVLLAWGWIDGQSRTIDEHWYAIRVTPRRPRSVWSKINVAHVERLLAEGRMQSSGLAQVEAAKADGRWDAAYGSPSNMEPPPELQAELDADPRLAAAFAALKKTERYSICWNVHNAKRAETKARRVAKFVDELRARLDGE
jgi:uncharacterized protein YdeI (YjbR/CyaY-like superfamily)